MPREPKLTFVSGKVFCLVKNSAAAARRAREQRLAVHGFDLREDFMAMLPTIRNHSLSIKHSVPHIVSQYECNVGHKPAFVNQ